MTGLRRRSSASQFSASTFSASPFSAKKVSALPVLAATVLASALVLSACTTVPQEIPSLETPTSQSPELESPVPEPAKPAPDQVSAVSIPDGQIDAAVARLDELARDALRDSKVPGLSVAIVRDGKTVYAKGFGVRSIDATDQHADTEVDADTAFPLGAVSQSIAATVVAAQLGAGPTSSSPTNSGPTSSGTASSSTASSSTASSSTASSSTAGWDTPVRELMPSFATADPYVTEHATIGDLFAHRSGLPDAGALATTLGFDRQQVLTRLPALPLDPFRATSTPSDIGLTAAAEAVAQSAGADWASLSQRLLFEPLAMTSTSSRSADFLARGNHAVGHVVQGGSVAVAPAPLQPDALSPAAGVSSSANDMARWMAMLLDDGSAGGRQIIAPGDLLPALSPQAVPTPPATVDARSPSRAFGFEVSTSASGRVHLSSPADLDGGAGGGSAAFTLIPSASVGIVVLANASDSWAPAALAAQFADLAETGELTQDWPALAQAAVADVSSPSGSLVGAKPPAKSSPAAALTSYDGAYESDFFGPATVTTSNDSLILTLGPQSERFPLQHWDGDTFTMTPPAGSVPPGSISRVVFSDGALQIEYLDGNGLGTFTRN